MDFDTGDGASGSGVRDISVGEFDELSQNAASVGSSSVLHQSVEIVTQRTWLEYVHGHRARFRGMRQMPVSSNGVWPGALNIDTKGKRKRVETEAQSQIVYRNVCMAEDPPYSVAISPNRQCVAFGCKAGVELYWVCRDTGI